MIYNDQTVFTLGNDLAAVSAITEEGRITATDGQNCQIHLFDSAGRLTERICSARSYRRLRRFGQTNAHTATACCNSSDIFILDDSFNENARITLDSPCACTRCGVNGLVDAQAVCSEEGNYFIGAYSQGAYLFDENGARLKRLCRTDADEALTDFIAFGEECYAFATVCGNTQTVSISLCGDHTAYSLPRRYILRMLFYENSTLYGLFGRNYLYNHIIPLYRNGVFCLPK